MTMTSLNKRNAPLAKAQPVPVVLNGSTSGIRVIAVDDDEFFREMLTRELAEHGFEVESFPDGESFLGSIANAADAVAIILDWGLPRKSGIELLQQVRRLGVTLPIVFLTGRALAANEIRAFDCGALDFIDKARGMEILVRRLRLLVSTPSRAPEAIMEKILQCGRLVLRPRISRAYWDDVDLDLTLGEFNIVHLLAANIGQHVTYRAIYNCMHYNGFIAGYGEHGYRTNVRSAIKRIRGKFRARDPEFAEIENYTAFGYVWGSSRSISH